MIFDYEESKINNEVELLFQYTLTFDHWQN